MKVKLSAPSTDNKLRLPNRVSVYYYIHSQKKGVLSRTLKGSSAQRSAGTFKGSRWKPLEMFLGRTLPEEP